MYVCLFRLSKPCDDVTHTEREQTKRVVYSILYGIGEGFSSFAASAKLFSMNFFKENVFFGLIVGAVYSF